MQQMPSGAINHTLEWPQNKSRACKIAAPTTGTQKISIQNIAKCLGVIFREVRSSSQSVQMKHIHFNYWPHHREVRFAAWVIKMALLISPNVYQPSSHYPTSLIMQDPCLHQCSFEQSLTKCLCECLMHNLTQTLNFPAPTRYPGAHPHQYVHNLDLHKHPIWAEAHFLRQLLKAPSVAVSLGAPARPVWPLSIRLKDQLIAPTPGRKLTATFSHSTKSTLRSKAPFLFVQVTWEQFLQK